MSCDRSKQNYNVRDNSRTFQKKASIILLVIQNFNVAIKKSCLCQKLFVMLPSEAKSYPFNNRDIWPPALLSLTFVITKSFFGALYNNCATIGSS